MTQFEPVLPQKISRLVLEIMEDDRHAEAVAATVISVAAIMTRQLSEGQRRRIAEHMRREADAVTGAFH
jgi:hypothetical protein